jgi:putative transposase
MSLESSSHAKFDLKYHFVWCPKYRRLALKGNIGKYIANIVHLFVSTTPTLAPAKLIQIVKSITAREAFKRFPSVSRLL